MAARATRDLASDELVAELPAFALPTVVPGEAIALEAHFGAVNLTRTVRALQASRPGQRLFVRTSEGQVFAVDCPDGQR